jgi:Na+/proline symporter
VTDIYRPLLAPGRTERHYVAVSRLAVVGFGLVLAALAFGFSYFDRILWLAFKIAGVTFGSLLGVFLLGLLTRLSADRANATAMTLMALVNLVLLTLAETGVIRLGWSWLVILGTAGTMALAALLAPVLDGAPRRGAPRSRAV